jgi:hypothetical protein
MTLSSGISSGITTAISRAIGSGGGAAGGGGGGPSLTLDNITSAVLAWSIARKLRTAHSGSLIRVRESAGSTEADIGASDNVLDESALTTHTGANSGYVTKYYDQTGDSNAVDFVQATANLQPRIVASGTVDKVSGKPTAKQSSAISALGYCESDNWTTRPSSAVMFLVCQRGASSQAFITTRSSSFYAMYAANAQADTGLSLGTGTNSIDIDGTLLATTGVQTRDQLFDGLPVSSLFLATIRGLNLSNAALAYIRQARAFDVASLGLDCVTEMIILDSPTTEEIDAVEADIATFYGITLP